MRSTVNTFYRGSIPLNAFINLGFSDKKYHAVRGIISII